MSDIVYVLWNKGTDEALFAFNNEETAKLAKDRYNGKARDFDLKRAKILEEGEER